MSDIEILTDDGYIVSNPAILGGTPCIRGTRLNVYAIAARVGGSETPEDIVAENPHVSVEMVLAAASYAREHPQVEHPDGKPWRKKARQAAE